ncbi:MAG TPA: hypothetical protein VFU47_05275, partial [Armatimonadota bacterium]|nr:hypothetical protein [Armatimonadota bacterium]
ARRWGQADFSVYVEEARQGLRAPEGPQWEVLLRGGGPPETSYRLVRLTLREKQGVLESIRSHAVTSSSLKDGEATAETHRLELSGSRTKRVLKLLADLEPPLERAEAQPGRAALEIAVLRREPPLCSRGRLYPQDGDKELTATGRLAAEVLSLADEAPGAG